MESSVEWWRWVLLGLLFAVLLIAWWWVNRERLDWRKLAKPPQRAMKVLETQWISHQVALFLVEIDGQRFMLARTPGNLAWQPLEKTKQSEKAEEKST